MIISLIAATSENNVIGKDGKIPWHLPAEWKYMRAVTMGKPAIMGRKTYNSIQAIGRAPLPGRRNIVITRNKDLQFEGADIVSTIEEAIELAKKDPADEAFIFGGEEIYKLSLPYADRIYLTRVHTTIEGGEAFFPEIDWSEWNEVSKKEHPADSENAIPFTMLIFERK
nr:Dihydrofolate reductase [uncultured bacterium]